MVNQSPLSGMTLNERLYTLGLLDDFGEAARRRDKPAMINLLKKLDLSEPEASNCVETILSDPKKYGY
jgi:HD-like signal output (HDOD) protein